MESEVESQQPSDLQTEFENLFALTIQTMTKYPEFELKKNSMKMRCDPVTDIETQNSLSQGKYVSSSSKCLKQRVKDDLIPSDFRHRLWRSRNNVSHQEAWSESTRNSLCSHVKEDIRLNEADNHIVSDGVLTKQHVRTDDLDCRTFDSTRLSQCNAAIIDQVSILNKLECGQRDKLNSGDKVKPKQDLKDDLVPSEFRHRLWQSRKNESHQAALSTRNSLCSHVKKDIRLNEADNHSFSDGVIKKQHVRSKASSCTVRTEAFSCSVASTRLPQCNVAIKHKVFELNKIESDEVDKLNSDDREKPKQNVKTDMVPSTFRHQLKRSVSHSVSVDELPPPDNSMEPTPCYRKEHNSGSRKRMQNTKDFAVQIKSKGNIADDNLNNKEINKQAIKNDLTVVKRDDSKRYRTDVGTNEIIVNMSDNSIGERPAILTVESFVDKSVEPLGNENDGKGGRKKFPEDVATKPEHIAIDRSSNVIKDQDDFGAIMPPSDRIRNIANKVDLKISQIGETGPSMNIKKRKKLDSFSSESDRSTKKNKDDSVFTTNDCGTKDTIIKSLETGSIASHQRGPEKGKRSVCPTGIVNEVTCKDKKSNKNNHVKCQASLRNIESSPQSYHKVRNKSELKRDLNIEHVIGSQDTLSEKEEFTLRTDNNRENQKVHLELKDFRGIKPNLVKKHEMNLSSLEDLFPLVKIKKGNKRKAKEDVVKKQRLCVLDRRYSNNPIWNTVVSKFD